MTVYLEDLREGSEYLSASRTISSQDITAFAGLSGDFSPLHTDDEWTRENTPFSGRIAHGALIFSASRGCARRSSTTSPSWPSWGSSAPWPAPSLAHADR
jgi:acyl dehydratase